MGNNFVVIDGVDGCGKGTQIDLLKDILPKDVLFTHEPGGTPFAEEIRKFVLRTHTEKISPISYFFMFWAARDVHVQNKILPALKEGKRVISDRFDSSTFAFQIRGDERRDLENLFSQVRNYILKDCSPFYIFLDLPPEVSLERMEKDANREKTHFDLKPLDYHERVRDGFKEFASRYPDGYMIVDANRSVEEIHEEIKQLVFGQFRLLK